MKKETKNINLRKLSLHRETLRRLDTTELGLVQGGTASRGDDCSDFYCTEISVRSYNVC